MKLSQIPSDVGDDQSDLVDSLLCIQSIERALEARVGELVQSRLMDDLGCVFCILDKAMTDVEKLTRKHFGRGKVDVDAAVWIHDSLRSALALARALRDHVCSLLEGGSRREVERLFAVLTSMLAWEAARFKAIDDGRASPPSVVQPIRQEVA